MVGVASFQTLYLEKGAELLGSTDLQDWHVVAPLPSYGKGRESNWARYGPLLGAYNATNVAIAGEGTINGQGHFWWEAHKKGELKYTRPRLVEFEFCTGVSITGVTMRNSPFWTVHPYACTGVFISGVEIHNPTLSPNTDGIDPDSCQDVLITHCRIASGDDNISIKSGMDAAGRFFARPSQNITVSHVEFLGGTGAAIGSEMSGDVRDITFQDCSFYLSANVVRIKTGRGRGGVVENIWFQDLSVDGVAEAISINMFSHSNLPPQPPVATPTVRNIRMVNIKGVAAEAGNLNCLPESPCTGIHMEHVEIVAPLGFRCSNATGSSLNVLPKSCLLPEDAPAHVFSD